MNQKTLIGIFSTAACAVLALVVFVTAAPDLPSPAQAVAPAPISNTRMASASNLAALEVKDTACTPERLTGWLLLSATPAASHDTGTVVLYKEAFGSLNVRETEIIDKVVRVTHVTDSSADLGCGPYLETVRLPNPSAGDGNMVTNLPPR